ncbi:Crp/Fnr family transcriptional regulator [Ruegeria sp. WL0004]|uniref:Crp/Fnr family transcriptional regulator n=1 Tax=Ruegeria marisflavi TaxID=2984152 RepID=A0ABT2WPF8_9RHOB|nr:Crp/Fnr family transcriptional regulator [Ruegeria sp. WL0004]MCU9837786.1 Crp/Fnr family transcriptional regulator [Ruegeria sp. WL0004]
MISLPQSGFLAEASPRLRQMLSAQANEVRLERGAVLFKQGDAGDALYVVIDGAMEVSILSLDGRKLSLDLLAPGAIFGEIALFDPGTRTATVTATEPARLLRVLRADVMRELQDHPELAVDMIRLAGQRMRWMGRQLNEQVFLPVPTRVARKLLHLAPRQGAQAGAVRLSQAELAEYVGATREAISKTLAVWKRQGIVDVTRGHVLIRDFPTLEALADPDQI